jgi:hypothetical protein
MLICPMEINLFDRQTFLDCSSLMGSEKHFIYPGIIGQVFYCGTERKDISYSYRDTGNILPSLPFLPLAETQTVILSQ